MFVVVCDDPYEGVIDVLYSDIENSDQPPSMLYGLALATTASINYAGSL